MSLKIFMIVNLCVITNRAEQMTNDIKLNFSKLPVSSNFSDFFNTWKRNSEKIEDVRTENALKNSILHRENYQKRKQLESKITTLQDLYDERNWKTLENDQLPGHGERNSRQMPVALYDSLLTRRTFLPSFKTILIELSLMTLSIMAVNALENAMAQKKKTTRIKVNPYPRPHSIDPDRSNYL